MAPIWVHFSESALFFEHPGQTLLERDITAEWCRYVYLTLALQSMFDFALLHWRESKHIYRRYLQKCTNSHQNNLALQPRDKNIYTFDLGVKCPWTLWGLNVSCSIRLRFFVFIFYCFGVIKSLRTLYYTGGTQPMLPLPFNSLAGRSFPLTTILVVRAGSITHLTSSGSFDDGRLLPAATNGSDVVGRNDWSLYSR